MTARPFPGDRTAVAAAAIVAALLILQQVAGRALRDALFLSAYSVASLPGMMVASALVSVCGALAFASAGARRSPAGVLRGVLTLSALLFAVEWYLAAERPRLVAAAVYVQLALIAPGIISSFWSLVNERFDPYTARRVVGRIGTGASLGGVVGGALAWGGAQVMPVPALLLGLSATSLVALVALPRLPAVSASDQWEAEPPGGVLTGVRWIQEFPYLRQLAALVALGALADALLDYLVKAGAADRFASSQQLASFFSIFYASVALLTLAVQATVTRRALERVGLSGTVAFQPALVALTAAAGLAFPSLVGAVAARGLGGALRDSLFRSGYELFYAPLPPWRKRRTKALVDVAADKLGSLAGAGVVMLVAALPFFSARALWSIALLAMLASLLLARRLHHGYVGALEQSLRSGLVALGSDEVVDATTRLTMTRAVLDRESLLAEIHALEPKPPDEERETEADGFLQVAAELRSGGPERIRRALANVPSPPGPELVALLIPLLGRDELFPQVLRALRSVAQRATGQLVDALVDAAELTTVRQRIPRVLKASPTARSVEGLLLGLRDSHFAVRRASGLVLTWLLERNAGLAVPAQSVHGAIAMELRTPVADREGQLDHIFVLLSAVGRREPLRVSRWALRSEDLRLRGTALEYLEQVLPEAVRQPLLDRLGRAPMVSRPRRGLDEVEEELRRSAVSLPRAALAGRRPRS
jgi:AAA family ATP:ADP antiporter